MGFAYIFYAKQYYDNRKDDSFLVIILLPCYEQVTRTEYTVYSVTLWQLIFSPKMAQILFLCF